MAKTFDCPKCGAPVTYERSPDPTNTKTTIRCDYCHSQLIAPNKLTGQPPQVVRIFVGDMKGIQVFDANGRFLSIIRLRGMPFGLVFNDNNELFVAARDQVIKYSVKTQ